MIQAENQSLILLALSHWIKYNLNFFSFFFLCFLFIAFHCTANLLPVLHLFCFFPLCNKNTRSQLANCYFSGNTLESCAFSGFLFGLYCFSFFSQTFSC